MLMIILLVFLLLSVLQNILYVLFFIIGEIEDFIYLKKIQIVELVY